MKRGGGKLRTCHLCCNLDADSKMVDGMASRHTDAQRERNREVQRERHTERYIEPESVRQTDRQKRVLGPFLLTLRIAAVSLQPLQHPLNPSTTY